jgi:hypothetical protein
LKSKNLNLPVTHSLTDEGLCTTLNGDTISNTYNADDNIMKEFIEVLDTKSGPTTPVRILGSGHIHNKEMWLNVRDTTSQEESKGRTRVAINDWKDFVSVRQVLIQHKIS